MRYCCKVLRESEEMEVLSCFDALGMLQAYRQRYNFTEALKFSCNSSLCFTCLLCRNRRVVKWIREASNSSKMRCFAQFPFTQMSCSVLFHFLASFFVTLSPRGFKKEAKWQKWCRVTWWWHIWLYIYILWVFFFFLLLQHQHRSSQTLHQSLPSLLFWFLGNLVAIMRSPRGHNKV